MIENCPQCSGELTPVGAGFKCAFCGATYASLQELHPRVPVQPVSHSTASAPYTPRAADHGVDVFDTNINGILEITWNDRRYRHSGSGFLISPNGYAITNTHVVTHENGTSCGTVNVRICGEATTADVIRLGDDHHGSGRGVDLALIKLARVPNGAAVVEFENFDNVRNGERVFVIGNSLGHGTCITSGIVSDKLRSVNGKMLLMTDCAINGGNSGGPMFNERGLVVGAVVSGITNAEGMNFVIPSPTILAFIGQSNVAVKPYQAREEPRNMYEDSTPSMAAISGEYTGKPEKPTPPPRPSLAPCPDCGASATIDGNFIVCNEDPDHVHPAN